MPDRRRRLAEILVDRRESLGLSRKEVVELSGISYPYLSQLESGDREPSMDTLAKLAGALQVEIADLVSGVGAALPKQAPPAPGASVAEAVTASNRPWVPNRAFAGPSQPRAAGRGSKSGSSFESTVDEAFGILSRLPRAQRLDAAGALLARCLQGK